MKKTLILGLSVAVLGLTACESWPTSRPAGDYKSTDRSVNARGTETEQTTKTHVYYDANGNKRANQETTTTKDPKGLFNKSTSTTTKSYN